jgi:hypothetical protein
MKAGIIISGSGPILILTSYDNLSDPDLLTKLANKGLEKFIAFEVPVELCEERYGVHYTVIMGDLSQTDDLRVLDYNGYSILKKFSFTEMGSPQYHE